MRQWVVGGAAPLDHGFFGLPAGGRPSPGSPSAPSPRQPSAEITTAIAHLRGVLGEQTYESLARKGEAMTTAAMAAHAFDQIDRARAELNVVSNKTTYEGLKTSCRRWHGDMPDIVDQR